MIMNNYLENNTIGSNESKITKNFPQAQIEMLRKQLQELQTEATTLRYAIHDDELKYFVSYLPSEMKSLLPMVLGLVCDTLDMGDMFKQLLKSEPNASDDSIISGLQLSISILMSYKHFYEAILEIKWKSYLALQKNGQQSS